MNESAENEVETELEIESQQVEEIEDLEACIEALIFTNGAPLSVSRISSILKIDEEKIAGALITLKESLSERGSGLELVEVSQGFQLRTVAAFSEQIRLLKESRPRKLTPAALETLAIIAYRQPIVKSDIESIRGVDAAPTIKTLLDRGLVRIVGHQATVGQPALYGTTDQFLEIFGLRSLNELPSLRDLSELNEEPGEIEESEEEPADETNTAPEVSI